MKKFLLSGHNYVLGLSVKRCNIRRVCGEVENLDSDGYDLNQESALPPCTLVRIMNIWGNYYYIKSHMGEGWVSKDSIAEIDKSVAEEFLYPEEFCVITEPNVTLGSEKYMMSCKIPLKNSKMLLPIKIENKLEFVSCKMKEGCHRGYLPFSRNTVISQAFKFLETPYSWGEKDHGLDCSALLMYSFACCGITFPRSSAEQSKITFPVSSYNINCWHKARPADIIFSPGHVMLSLGGKHIIHASASKGKVCVDNL